MESNAIPAPHDRYDEDTVAGLVVALYQALIKIGGIEDSDVAWAPPAGHSIDLSKLSDDARIDTRVISLMQKLPIMKNPEVQILPRMCAVNYRDGWSLARSRSIDYAEGEIDTSNAAETVLMLFGPASGGEGDNDAVVLDVANNTVRIVDGPVFPPDTYLDLPTQHAPTWLREKLSQYHAGFFVPDMRDQLDQIGPSGSSCAQKLHRTLVEEYGWPDAFDREAWKRDVQGLVDGYREEEDYRESCGGE